MIGGEEIRDSVEDFVVGVVCAVQWFEDWGKGIITFLIALIYMFYKIGTQIEKRKKAKAERELIEAQLNDWRKLTKNNNV